MLKKTFLFFSFSFLLVSYQVCYGYPSFAQDKEAQLSDIITPAKNVITRSIGEKAEDINFGIIPSINGLESFNIEAKNGILHIEGSSTVALCYAFNTYLKEACHSMITWSGKHLNIPASWPDHEKKEIVSPYQFRYYLNVVTFGYTTPYWDWERWEQEIDWMALHGINMPLAPIASEAIAERVWLKLGLTKEEINEFFTGPA
jgi:alpha-N-acetylglucosaminidase